ncbi:5-methyltetrahydropteroyltriglutamate--homocysteine methyltransferase [Gammaproteobacteria bacterium]|nr:5-methyltetrahydropteroyltriglutamate--homocysteine methyltransferase [Gammaproteobacteria bacterium]
MILPTSVIGSYAWPSWFITAVEAMKRGDYGPVDMQETLNDAVDLALRDQEDAGVDIISDGEMRRLGFFTADFYNRLTGLRTLPPDRLLGPAGHDQREHYEALEPITAPNGLGLVSEFEYVRTRTTRSIKMPCPGPFTLAGRIVPGSAYKDRMDVAHALAEIINAELKALVAAGVNFIQLDEPSYAVHPEAARRGTPRDFVELFNATVNGVSARIGLHLCFGNFVGRPVAKRTYAPLFPHILDTRTDELALEFANRELFEIEVGKQVAEAGKTLAAGLIDVKNYYIETPDDVAQRIRTALKYVPADKLTIVPDCGFSQTARWASRAKLKAMVDGVKIVRGEIVANL